MLEEADQPVFDANVAFRQESGPLRDFHIMAAYTRDKVLLEISERGKFEFNGSVHIREIKDARDLTALLHAFATLLPEGSETRDLFERARVVLSKR